MGVADDDTQLIFAEVEENNLFTPLVEEGTAFFNYFLDKIHSK